MMPTLGRGLLGVVLLAGLAACAPATSRAVTGPDVQATLPALPTEHLRVLVMGDQGTGTEVQRRVAAAMRQVCAREGCDLGVGLGDNIYPAGPRDPGSPLLRERFADVYGPLGVPFLMIPGNHDESWQVGGDGADPRGAEAQVAYGHLNPQWVMPARTYRAAVGALVEFFAVDTAPLAAYVPGVRPEERPGGAWDTAQRTWLAGAVRGSGARWRLVLGHHPLFSNGRHGDAGAYDGLPFAFQRGDAVRELYGVVCGQADALLSGHVHALEVFAPQAGCPGTWTLVSGAAGEVGGGPVGARPAAFSAFSAPGFLRLDVTPGTLVVWAYTVSEDGTVTAREAARLTKSLK
ncbi:metallophosphoesterase [Deinococcus taeanensis]|uniref:metallophosphoesterase n=1 Tax=Deinococcus taeanensis TaxID=2737050 RepID=UPI001CDC1C5B|nr:metallophosphoesterase [Deinococcus taeanensis]UBV43203.1 metallophosphoesterase [Deinococcus taeanensis]